MYFLRVAAPWQRQQRGQAQRAQLALQQARDGVKPAQYIATAGSFSDNVCFPDKVLSFAAAEQWVRAIPAIKACLTCTSLAGSVKRLGSPVQCSAPVQPQVHKRQQRGVLPAAARGQKSGYVLRRAAIGQAGRGGGMRRRRRAPEEG